MTFNWDGAYEEVSAKNVSLNANTIGSHFVFRSKRNNNGERRLKTSLARHGNRDRNRYTVRRDWNPADLSAMHLLFSFATIFDFDIATADVKGAYMQPGCIQRDLYVRPPKRLAPRSSTLLKLIRLPYGIIEAGRQWLCAVEAWLIRTYTVSKLITVDKYFYKNGGGDIVEFLIVMVV